MGDESRLAAILGMSPEDAPRDDDSGGIKLSYYRSFPNKYTFRMRKVKKWVENALEGRVLNLYAGPTKLDYENIVSNDIDEAFSPDYAMDAAVFTAFWKQSGSGPFDTVILDPPYSERKAMQKYGRGTRSTFQAVKASILDILSPRGVVITFGYTSVCMGKQKGFVTERVALICHGGSINDTIGVAERWIVDPKSGEPFE